MGQLYEVIYSASVTYGWGVGYQLPLFMVIAIVPQSKEPRINCCLCALDALI